MRAADKDIIITLGPQLSVKGDLVSPKQSKTSKAGKAAGNVQTRNACPTCHEGGETSFVNKRYICEDYDDHGPFEEGDLAKALVTDTAVTTVATKEELAEARKVTDGAPGVIRLTAHPADEVLSSTLNGDLCWVVRPGDDDVTEASFQILLAMIGHGGHIDLGDGSPGAVLLAEAVIVRKSRLVRLDRWGDQLVVQELVRPADLKEGLALNDTPPDPRLVDGGRRFVETFTVEFDPSNYVDTTNDRLRELMGDAGDMLAKVTHLNDVPEKTTTVDDLLAQLQVMVDAKEGTAA